MEISDRLKAAYDPESFRARAHRLVDQLADYLTDVQARKMPVHPWVEPEQQQRHWDSDFESPTSDLDRLFDDYIARGQHVHHPRFVGHQMSPSLPLAALGDLAASVLNNSAAIYEMGPSATVIERTVLRWMAKQIGYGEESDGIFTSGGTLGNLTALLGARQQIAGSDPWTEGCPISGPRPVILVSDQAHYSIDRAVRIMGWGDAGMERITSFKDLGSAKRRVEESGRKVVAVVASSCSTATGSYDPLEPIADFTEAHRLWLHVDGAHGAAAALSPKYRHLVQGIERADSVVWDAHKMLLAPALTTAVLFRRQKHSLETFNQQASYLFQKGAEEEWFNLCHRTLECTKRDFTFRFYLMLRAYGPELFVDYVNYTYDLARELAAMLKREKDFELATEPQANIVCFRPRGLGDDEITALRKRMIADGKFYLVQTKLPGGVFLRTTLMNPQTTIADLVALLDEIRRIAKSKN